METYTFVSCLCYNWIMHKSDNSTSNRAWCIRTKASLCYIS